MLFLPKSVKEISETNKVSVKVSSKHPAFNTTDIKEGRTFLIAGTIRIISHFYITVRVRSGEEITPGPQKEGETRTTTVALCTTKSQDHLDSQATSLDDDTNHDNTITVPFVAGKPKVCCKGG